MKNNVIAHIAGPADSGKNYLGDIIKSKYSQILVKDLDDFNDEIITNRFLNINELIRQSIINILKE
jgi:hypothetical protein